MLQKNKNKKTIYLYDSDVEQLEKYAKEKEQSESGVVRWALKVAGVVKGEGKVTLKEQEQKESRPKENSQLSQDMEVIKKYMREQPNTETDEKGLRGVISDKARKYKARNKLIELGEIQVSEKGKYMLLKNLEAK